MYSFNDHLSFTWYSPQFVGESFKTKFPNHGNKSCFESLGKSNRIPGSLVLYLWHKSVSSTCHYLYYYLTPVVKKHEVGMVTVNPKSSNDQPSTDPNPTSGAFPKHKGNARTLRILVTLPQIESIRLAYHSQVDPGDPGWEDVIILWSS